MLDKKGNPCLSQIKLPIFLNYKKIKQIVYDIIAISYKNLPRFTTEQETLLLNEKFIFNTKPLYEAEGIEPIPNHHDLY